MNHALRQSISSLFSGELRSSICKGISVNPRFTIFVENCHVNRPFVRGFKSNQQQLSCSSDEDDEFNELGPTVDVFSKLGSPKVQSAAALLKLVTEKPEKLTVQTTAATLKLKTEKPEITTRNGIFKNIQSDLRKGKLHPTSSPKADNNQHKKASATIADNEKHKKASATIADNNQHKKASATIADNNKHKKASATIAGNNKHKEASATIADNNKHKEASATIADNNKHKKASATIADNNKHKEASATIAINKNDSSLKIPSYVRIENVPSTVNLSQLMAAISKYGNASTASMTTLPNGVICCYVMFEDKVCWRTLISEGSIAVGNDKLSVSALCEKNSVMFRIKSICRDTETDEIQSICSSFGKLEYLDRVTKNVAYAIFTSMNKSETQSLLAKLNNVSFESCLWTAEVQLEEYSKDDDVHEYYKLKSNISSALHEVRNEALLKVIDAEDLVNLHSSIMAIENQVKTTCYRHQV